MLFKKLYLELISLWKCSLEEQNLSIVITLEAQSGLLSPFMVFMYLQWGTHIAPGYAKSHLITQN